MNYILKFAVWTANKTTQVESILLLVVVDNFSPFVVPPVASVIYRRGPKINARKTRETRIQIRDNRQPYPIHSAKEDKRHNHPYKEITALLSVSGLESNNSLP